MKKISIVLDETTAHLVAWVVDFAKYQAEEGERKDPLKDNGYIIKACEDFAKAYEEATK